MNRRSLPDRVRSRLKGVAFVVAFFAILATYGLLSNFVFTTEQFQRGAGFLVLTVGTGIALVVAGATYFGLIYALAGLYRRLSDGNSTE